MNKYISLTVIKVAFVLFAFTAIGATNSTSSITYSNLKESVAETFLQTGEDYCIDQSCRVDWRNCGLYKCDRKTLGGYYRCSGSVKTAMCRTIHGENSRSCQQHYCRTAGCAATPGTSCVCQTAYCDCPF
jgi:hypothetical protein